MSSNLKAQLKKLQDAKQYAAMIVLLEASNEPNKQAVIQRIKARMVAEAPAPAPAPVMTGKPLPGTEPLKEVPAKRRRIHPMLSAILITAMIPVVFMIGHTLNMYIHRYPLKMEEVCRTLYRDDWRDGRYTFNQWYYGCQAAAAQAMDFYGREIAYCYDTHNQTDRLFEQCLVTEGVRVYSAPLSEAAP